MVFVEDFFERIINVQWGSGDCIVVIIPTWFGLPVLNGSYEILAPKDVTHLEDFTVNYQHNGFQASNNAFAFQVAKEAGSFITVNTPTIPQEAIDAGSSNYVYVMAFAIDPTKTDDQNLNRAKAGARLVVVADYAITSSSSDSPSQVDPPGLIWSIAMYADSAENITFKIGFNEHRKLSNSPLPNEMVEIYPLTSAVMIGYYIYAYRLDGNGVGPSYGVGPVVPTEGGGPTNPLPGSILDPAWQQVVYPLNVIGFTYGIPLQDPPPLVAVDVQSTGGGFRPPF